MRQTPRTVRPLRASLLAALALSLLPAHAISQQRRPTKPRPSATANNAERARRALAVTLLIETADRARLFDDLFYRTWVQAEAADALWPHDARQARAIFRRAWEAAAAYDKAEQGDILDTNVRDALLIRVAARDKGLAEEFLNNLSKEKAGEGDSGQKPAQPHSAWRELSPAGERRLDIAQNLLHRGEPRRAAEIIAPVLDEGVNSSLVAFILYLRDWDVSSADLLYMRLLERAAADPRTDANDVLLLSAPVVSPNLLVHVDEFGSLKFMALPPATANPSSQRAVPEAVQTAFYNLAAAVLLRQAAPNGEPLTMQELIAAFYTTGRLLPFFQNSSAPYAAYAPALGARHSELFNRIEAGRRDQVSSQFAVSSMTQTANTDPLRLWADNLSRTTDPSKRERIIVTIVKTAVSHKFWDRARRAAAEIEDTDLRAAANTFIQVHQIKDISDAYKEDKENDSEGAARFVRNAEVPPFAKAWGLAQAASIAARKRTPEGARAVAALINEAEGFASRTDQGTPERVAAYGVVAETAARLDPPRAWALLHETVKAANAVEDFTGDESSFVLAGDGEGSGDDQTRHFVVESEVFRLDGFFATMARLDFDKALAEARALDGDVPRALATVAAARAILEKK